MHKGPRNDVKELFNCKTCMPGAVKCRPTGAFWVQIDGINIATELITRYYLNETLIQCCFNARPTSATLAQHWTNIEEMYNVWEKVLLPQQTQDICITFIQRRPNVFDVGPILHKVIQMFYVYWDVNTNFGSSSFNIPAVIQSVCLQASDQVGARAKSFELLTHRCRSSIYELAVIWELALNEASGMKRIFSIIME